MKKVYFISDSTGITAETFGKSLLANFPNLNFDYITKSYIKTIEDLSPVLKEIKSLDEPPIIFISVLNADIVNEIKMTNAFHIDLFTNKLKKLETFLHTKSNQLPGRGDIYNEGYQARIEAINFALENDDGISSKSYEKADLILIGVSRASKTPTSLYIGMQFGVFCANYPFVEDDFALNYELPAILKPFQKKLMGLNIDPYKLASIREQRKANSKYASVEQCIFETKYMDKLYEMYNIPNINSTAISIEEIATKCLSLMNIKKRI